MIEQWRKNNWSQGGKKPMQHFFETNHTGELPIILKRRTSQKGELYKLNRHSLRKKKGNHTTAQHGANYVRPARVARSLAPARTQLPKSSLTLNKTLSLVASFRSKILAFLSFQISQEINMIKEHTPLRELQAALAIAVHHS